MSNGTNPFVAQLTAAKKTNPATLDPVQRPSFLDEEPVRKVTYVYGQDIQTMSKQQAITAVRALEQYRSELVDIETSAKAFDVEVEQCSGALNELTEYLNDHFKQ